MASRSELLDVFEFCVKEAVRLSLLWRMPRHQNTRDEAAAELTRRLPAVRRVLHRFLDAGLDSDRLDAIADAVATVWAQRTWCGIVKKGAVTVDDHDRDRLKILTRRIKILREASEFLRNPEPFAASDPRQAGMDDAELADEIDLAAAGYESLKRAVQLWRGGVRKAKRGPRVEPATVLADGMRRALKGWSSREALIADLGSALLRDEFDPTRDLTGAVKKRRQRAKKKPRRRPR